MKSLKDEADFTSAIGRRVGKIRYRVPSVAQCPGGGPVERAQQLKQSGLSAAAGTGDGHEVVLRDAETHSAQRLHLPIIEILLQTYRLEDKRLGGLSNGR